MSAGRPRTLRQRPALVPCSLLAACWVVAALQIVSSGTTLAVPHLTLDGSTAAIEHFQAQVQPLVQLKATRTPGERKLDSALLYEIKRRRGDAPLTALPKLRTGVPVDPADGAVLVDITARVTETLLAKIKRLGGAVVSDVPQHNSIRARVPLKAIEPLAAFEEVRSIRRAYPPMLNKIDTSEGDVAHAADSARVNFAVDGGGVKVGVLSDSVDALASLQASGDLPAVTVLPGQSGVPGTSEGTAMLEIVHDLAPGTALYFATAFGGEAVFAQNIVALWNAGCDVIVDDVRYFTEPVFQDGIVAQAVEQISRSGALYFSSAGNSGNLNDGQSGVWEGDYVGIIDSRLPGYQSVHVFSAPNVVGNRVIQDSPSFFVLQWSDAWGASGNDYDLFLVDVNFNVYEVSDDWQNGNGYPLEIIDSRRWDDSGLFLIVAKWSGEDRYLHLNSNRGRLQFGTDGQTSGHSAAENAFSVAAVNVATAAGGKFVGGTSNPVEIFSSDGPRRVFYTADGAPYTPGNFLSSGGEVRQKPDLAAADGVATATPGFDPFFGTSAAAPHAAAIAALMREADPAIDTANARSLFARTALDIEATGVDRDSGVGIVRADLVLDAIEARFPWILFLPAFTK